MNSFPFAVIVSQKMRQMRAGPVSNASYYTYQEQKKIAAAEAHRIAELLTSVKKERDEARKESRQAREESARLTGRIESLREQVAALMAQKNDKDRITDAS